MIKYDLLTEEECYGDNKLEIFKKRGFQYKDTDFARLLGASPEFSSIFNNAEFQGCWTKSTVQYKLLGSGVRCVTYDGGIEKADPFQTGIGTRILFVPDNVDEIMNNYNKELMDDGLIEVDYSYYPENAASKEIQEELNKTKELVDTGLVVHCPSRYVDGKLKVKELNVMSYRGKKYVKFVVGPIGSGIKLSNGEKYKLLNNVWLEVKPIRLTYIKEKKGFLTNDVLFLGLKYNNKFEADFEKTDLKNFLDNYFGKDVMNFNEKFSKGKKNVILDNIDCFEFNFDLVSEENIIKGCIMSDIPVFLHGQTGEGKSSRVKQLDPNLQVIYLQTMTPESLNGRNVYNESTGESIDKEPTWYKKLCERCDAEPDKLHIVFFDELTNATHTIQGMIYNIVLDREINGIWKLPKNARIVGAGNEKEESLSANEFSAPLFSRFAHVYIDTSPEAFLRWGSTPRNNVEAIDNEESKVIKKIHPAIISFIKYKHDNGEDILRTPYNGVTPNTDPRKWEMASKMLYETENPYMLRGLIGNELTNDFVAFIKEISRKNMGASREKTLLMK